MKKFSYSLNPVDVDVFFPHERIKTKVQVLTILLESARFLLFSEPEDKPEHSKIILQIKKMSRIFFIVENKYYSINFPFTFIIDNGKTHINFKNIIEINSKTISDLLSILKDSRFNSLNCLDFIDPICDLDDDIQDVTWQALRELLLIEEGYLRFDCDPKSHEEAMKKGKEHAHPENHLDLFYASNNSFKLGLVKGITDENFIDYLDVESDCMYLKKF